MQSKRQNIGSRQLLDVLHSIMRVVPYRRLVSCARRTEPTVSLRGRWRSHKYYEKFKRDINTFKEMLRGDAVGGASLQQRVER